MRRENFRPGKIYHIYNRGVDKRVIFNENADKWRFLQAMALFNNAKSRSHILWQLENQKEGANMRTLKKFFDDRAEKPLVKIMADCLMDNHYHLLLEEIEENGISTFMHKLGTSYTMYFNKKYDRSGSLFQGPFKAVKVENNRYLKYLLVYINIINPAELVGIDLNKDKGIEKAIKFASDYDWSTNKEFLDKRDSFVIDKGIFNNLFQNREEYKEFAKMALEEKKHYQIKELTLE